MKDIKYYLPFYLGCETNYGKLVSVDIYNNTVIVLVEGKPLAGDLKVIKPILRPLSSISEDEDQEFEYIRHRKDCNIYEGHAMQTAYLLFLRFDLFGLIEAGLAIDKTQSKMPKEQDDAVSDTSVK